MKLEKRSGEAKVLHLDPKNLEILFSYETAVAFRKNDLVFRMEEFYGPTTAKHFNNWRKDSIHSAKVISLADNEFESLLNKAIA